MSLSISEIDHVHVPIRDRDRAAGWYSQHLGFSVYEKLALWPNNDYAPLFLKVSSGTFMIALVKTDDFTPRDIIAFRCNGQELLKWRDYFKSNGMLDRVADHQACWSLYLKDCDGNGIEITSYDYELLSPELEATSTH